MPNPSSLLFLDLADDMIKKVMQALDPASKKALASTCRRIRSIRKELEPQTAKTEKLLHESKSIAQTIERRGHQMKGLAAADPQALLDLSSLRLEPQGHGFFTRCDDFFTASRIKRLGLISIFFTVGGQVFWGNYKTALTLASMSGISYLAGQYLAKLIERQGDRDLRKLLHKGGETLQAAAKLPATQAEKLQAEIDREYAENQQIFGEDNEEASFAPAPMG